MGEEALFADGCPVCGFTTDPQSTDRRAADRRPADLKPDKPGAPVKTGKGRETGSGGSSPGALPLWVYIVSALALAGMGYLVLTWLF
ncbi:hypothetical protein FACS1894130_10000 [Spirochaetia bacterium]|nr:hypothetical protein FACS1894130_10000 [Spirochaetia bacterium]